MCVLYAPKHGKTFKTNSSSVNYNPQFKRHKQEMEMEELNFETDTNENYNLTFYDSRT